MMMFQSILAVFLSVFVFSYGFRLPNARRMSSLKNCNQLSMGLGDMFKNALANDPNLPQENKPKVEPVVVEFLPSKKAIKAYPGQSIKMIAKAAGVNIKYKCEKGECRTCEINFDGKIVKACQSSIPITKNPSGKVYQIGILK
mmetsp:Transcript_2595/g.2745  ORF Transcript_2595/g.2745 Transcript_2595/m.2745 type:complete len:143 (+) Transcript_2595:37-465(+)